MWNNDHNQSGYGGAPSFPSGPGFPGADNVGIPTPHGNGYNPSYAPHGGPPGPPHAGYGAPPSGYGAPPGPPPPHGFPSPAGPPHGFPSAAGHPPQHGYPSPAGPPPSQGFPSPAGHPPSSHYGAPPGPPPTSGYFPPSGPPPSSGYAPPTGPPPPARGYPGQQYHAQNHQSGYPGQQAHTPGYQSQQGPQGGYSAPGANAFHPQGPPPRPPTTVQNYGPHFRGANNRDAQPFFQYSQCTGKKKALCIGINYFGQTGELRGCINDVTNIQNFLITQYGYKKEDMVTLTDDATNPRMQPTHANIVAAMQWLVDGANPNDSLFFHYSGHGGQTKDLDGDEADGYDEVIYPVDYESAGHIVDDEMHDMMVKPLPAGCRLTAIFDSCHSGSALDLPYIYSTEGKVKEPNLVAEAGQGLLAAVTSYARGDMGGVLKSAMGFVKTATGNTQKAEKLSKATRTSPADVISWSGCKDDQTSADTQEAGEATGAMSHAFISALGGNKQQSFQELLVSIREILRVKHSQKPQLSSSHPMDTNLMFIC
ncbi:hypothetical protein D9619_000540 [Psilocybe cf. subviscida]|uniref:Peptidase C14 caspase domain-containing protein n=1 Tax=Psilocybe cf. subviscida TaxID=2480587 RepID=A0A8H5BEC2_9AGAR|nr:hypothetical protein D9619_000540 [Psilocybe cf. subviscida]